MMRKSFWILTLAAVSATACGNNHPHIRTRLSPREFAYVMADLTKAQPAQRAAILKKHGVTDADLRDFVQKYAADPQTLSTAFDTAQDHTQP